MASTENETETGGTTGRPPRQLSPRERDVLVALITRGTHGENETVTDQDRARWLEQVAHTRAGRGCSCGACPSIELTDADGVTPDMQHSRVVLQASTPEALVLLFVDDDRLSYLELAPLGEEVSFHPFPDVADIAFGH